LEFNSRMMNIQEKLNKIKSRHLQVCSRCIYDETVSNIYFDEQGVCNYCLSSDELLEQYNTGKEEGRRELDRIMKQIKHEGRNKKYDCIIGVSGGTDSSYLLHLAVKEYGLRPLAVHYDNTWNSAIATENIRKVLSKLNVDIYTYVVDNKEVDDYVRSFMLAGVPELDAPTDIAAPEILYRACGKYGVKYVLEGHSFIAEGVSPMGNNYFDGKYIQDIHKKFGKVKEKTYPNMTFYRFLKWTFFKRIKKIRPLWYITYSKESAREILEKEYNWVYYGGHHLENRITDFTHSYYNPIKFSIDNRNWSLAAAARNGIMTREEALEIYCTYLEVDKTLLQYVKKRLELSDEEFERIMNIPKKSFRDYKTYKKRFELLRPFFYVLAKANLVPMSFYIKYCFPLEKH